MLKNSLIFCLFCLIATTSMGQKGLDILVWLDTQSMDEKQFVRGWLQNNGSSPVSLDYEVSFVFGTNQLTRSGTVLSTPLVPTLLSRSVFIFEKSEFDSIHLSVFNGDRLVGSAKITRKITPPARQSPPENTVSPTLRPEPTSPSPDIEIEGLVLDETRSKLAHDFYELFYSGWTASEVPSYGHIIVIREVPGQVGIGTRIVVEVDDIQLSLINLQPRGDMVEQAAQQLVTSLSEHLQNPDNFQELENDDLNGSGIY